MENTKVIIRRAAAEDAEKILDCCRAVGGESDNLTFGSEGVSMTVEKEREYLDSIKDSDRQLYLIAELEGEIVGTAIFSGFAKPRLCHRGEISISVKKALWGQHIGTRFMEEMLQFARETAKAEIVSLEVRSDNARAIALYKKFGFETVGRFRGYMKVAGEYVDCDLMRLEL